MKNMMKWILRRGIPCLLLMLTVMATGAEGKDLTVSVGLIPHHAEVGPNGRPRGGFIDLVKAMDEVYEEGDIIILGLFPFDRSLSNLRKGDADFHLPLVKVDEQALEDLVFSSEKIADLSEVLYTNAEKPEPDPDHLDRFAIQVMRGHGKQYPFKVEEISDFDDGILKAANGERDGFLTEQDAADAYIRAHRVKNIRRRLFRRRPVHIIFAKTPNVDELDRTMTTIIRKLRENGRLKEIMDNVHKPYEDWQPFKMDW